MKSGELQRVLAGDVVKEFELQNQGYLISGILSDCFHLYQVAFFNLMSEKQGLQAILLECLKIESIRDLLEVEDHFPEAYRPLQLVCLVLADDVSITEEMQSLVLDIIIEAYSTAPSEVLGDSFSRLLKELFSSDGKEIYLERIKKELLSTGNQTLRNYLVRVLRENLREESISKFLMGLVEKPGENADICRTIFSIRWMDYPIQHLPVCPRLILLSHNLNKNFCRRVGACLVDFYSITCYIYSLQTLQTDDQK